METSNWGRGNQSQSIPITHRDRGVGLTDTHTRLITIFDCKIDLAWKGTASDGTEVNGIVVVPEVSHEITVDKLSDYVVSDSWSITANGYMFKSN